MELEELTEKEILDILKGIRKIYQEHHGVKYTNKALLKILELGKKIQGRHAPDVQIDLLDEAGASAEKVRVCEDDIQRVFDVQYASNQTKIKTIGFGE